MKKKSLVPGIIVAIIILTVYFVKKIFPFGHDFIAWGDMHAQILALYYNFYDIVYNGKSFLIDFTGGTAINLLSNFAYYIISPFTPIILLFQRSDIPQAVSLIVLGKIVLSAITCNIFLDKKFDKLSNFYKCFFSILYALSTYNLSLYIITGWIDVVYLFPLLLLGLDKIINQEKMGMFIFVLSLCLIFNFYIALMCILFIFFATFIYLCFYGNKNKKRVATQLGISVVLSMMISSIILIPTVLQISSSARMGIDIIQAFSSKTGPIIDKFIFLSSTMAMCSCMILFLKSYKKYKKEFVFLISLLSLVGISLIIEPINKMLHFGSYVYYPYRYGFILVLLLIIGSCMYLVKKEDNNKHFKYSNLTIYTTTIICAILIIGITYYFYPNLQQAVDRLTFSSNKLAFVIIVILMILNLVPYIIAFALGNKNSKSVYICLMINLIVFTFTQSMIYIKIDHDEDKLHSAYDDMNYIYDLELDKNYHLKLQQENLIYNFGSVVDIPTHDFFTSLTDSNSFMSHQQLGYTSLWMDTTSIGGNYFTDFILSNKYLISNEKINNEFYKFSTMVNNLYLYDTTLPISKGYILEGEINNKYYNNSFDTTNNVYETITGLNENIIDIYSDFNFVNLKYENDKLSILNKEKESYMEITIPIDKEKTIYFEVNNSYLNAEKAKIYYTFDIYVNNDLIIEDCPSQYGNNSINIGTYNDDVNIKIIVKKDIDAFTMKLGVLDLEKVKKYFINNQYDIDINYNRNKLEINYDSLENKVLFIPITYLDGMTAINNGSDTEMIKLFGNFIGIKVSSGENNIVISYVTPGLKIGTVLSLIGIILSVIFIKCGSYLINLDIINNIIYGIYLILFILFTLIFYIVPFVMFIISYI